MTVHILVASADPQERSEIAQTLRALDVQVEEASDIAHARKVLGTRAWDYIVCGLHFVDGTALDLMGGTRCVVIHDSSNERIGRMLRRAGAYATCPRPLDPSRLEELVRTRPTEMNGILGNAPALRQLSERVQRVANSHATVLIEGESGTGKELVARALHDMSPRSNRPFVAMNCAALAPGLLESELFGHERGAFTGAHRSRKGRFELADRGTLLLDEVGEMDPAVQAKLLRTLEEMEVVRVGGENSIAVDVRVLAATNRNLQQCVDEGSFRADLYYRLNVVRLEVPPLRERREDIPLLVRAFIDELATQHGVAAPTVHADAMRELSSARWPGNVRELRNVVEQLLLMSGATEIGVAQLPDDFRSRPDSGSAGLTMRPIAEVERELIRNTLRDLSGNREQAARVLGISARTLYRRIKELGLS
jgi:two-component system response regulator HydG